VRVAVAVVAVVAVAEVAVAEGAGERRRLPEVAGERR
jgi:hypothetical protein